MEGNCTRESQLIKSRQAAYCVVSLRLPALDFRHLAQELTLKKVQSVADIKLGANDTLRMCVLLLSFQSAVMEGTSGLSS